MVPVGKTVCRSTGSLETVLEQFESFVVASESLYGVSLARPQLNCFRDLGKFCLGLVEKDNQHPWWAQVKELSARSRFGFAHSLFLFRKVIPKEKPLVSEYVDKLSVPSPDPDEEFLLFAKNLTGKIFNYGWDRSYQDACLSSTLPLTSCSEGGRSVGGCRGLQKQEWESRAEFCEYVLKANAARTRGVSRVQAIETGGKWRVISIPPLVDNALRPLHHAMYSHLSRFSWLLRGDAKPSRFKEFTPVEGEVFVSGDYESATDNLNSVLQEEVFRVLLENSISIPQGIVDHALSIYRSALDGGDGRVVTQRRGQLMGQLTSFPLLCLINYITFRYSFRHTRRRVPVRINGDDIVFRATPAEFSRWEHDVVKGGLTLSKGKTLVHSRGFTLNSTPFWSQRSGVKTVGFFRSSALFPKGSLSEQIDSLNGRFYSACAGYGGRRRSVVRELFLRQNQKAVWASRRSVTRGLELAVGAELLKTLGLWYRELFYLELVEERKMPSLKAPVPPGWKQVGASWFSSEDQKLWKRRWSDACIDYAWDRPVNLENATEDARMQQIRFGCYPYGLGTLIGIRVRKMLRLSRSAVWKWVNLRRNASVFGRCPFGRGKGLWVEVDQLVTRTQVIFVN